MKLNNALLIGSFGLATYFACIPKVLPIVNGILSAHSERIPPYPRELEQALEEEKKNVGLEESTNIEISFVPNLVLMAQAPATSRPERNGYHIQIDLRHGANRNSVRHELCHIKRGDPVPMNYNSYIYFYEPRAILCSILSEEGP